MTTPNLDRLIVGVREAAARFADDLAGAVLRAVPVTKEPAGQDPHRSGPPHGPDFNDFVRAGRRGMTTARPQDPGMAGSAHPAHLVLHVGDRGEVNGISYQGEGLPFEIMTSGPAGVRRTREGTIIQRIELCHEPSTAVWELRPTP